MLIQFKGGTVKQGSGRAGHFRLQDAGISGRAAAAAGDGKASSML